MKLLFFLLILILTPNHSFPQKALIRNNKIKSITEYRERYSPDIIKKEIYNRVVFDSSGKIIERYEKYYTPPKVLEKFSYDSSGFLIKYLAYKKDSSLYRQWSWEKHHDTMQRKLYTPYFTMEPQVSSWHERLKWWKSNGLKYRSVRIDSTNYFSKGFNKIIQVTARREKEVDTVVFKLLNQNIHYEASKKWNKEKLVYNFWIKYNKNSQPTEQLSTGKGITFFHFKYFYYKNGLLKKLISFDKKGKVQEVVWHKIEYYTS
ncbi:MAG TPA: hypothetical protein VGP43_08140 [Chitinophagaceae bacterium]|nr:hypothetical protein [Chitinophagaceae bacterium]